MDEKEKDDEEDEEEWLFVACAVCAMPAVLCVVYAVCVAHVFCTMRDLAVAWGALCLCVVCAEYVA